MPNIEWFWQSTGFSLPELMRKEKKRASGPTPGATSAKAPIVPHFPWRALLVRDRTQHQTWT